jgi:hypothetical protein
MNEPGRRGNTPWAADIGAALDKYATAVMDGARDRWVFALSNGIDLHVSARLEDDWLLLESAPLPRPTQPIGEPLGERTPWEVLRWHAGLSSGVKFATAPTATALSLRAELPLIEDCDVRTRIREACAALKMAGARRAGRDETTAAPVVAASADAGAAADVFQLCRETTWNVIEREPGTAMVDLEVPGAFQQAAVRACAGGGVVVSAALATERDDPLSPARRHALGLLLLRTGGVVRMARAATDMDDGTGARFEVVFAGRPHPAELAHAIAALSVAWRLAGAEANVLANDEAVAREYLKTSPWLLVPGP